MSVPILETCCSMAAGLQFSGRTREPLNENFALHKRTPFLFWCIKWAMNLFCSPKLFFFSPVMSAHGFMFVCPPATQFPCSSTCSTNFNFKTDRVASVPADRALGSTCLMNFTMTILTTKMQRRMAAHTRGCTLLYRREGAVVLCRLLCFHAAGLAWCIKQRGFFCARQKPLC